MANTKNQSDPDAANMQREIQQQQDQSDQRGKQETRANQIGDRQGPVQTTQHDYPGTPLPAQHLEKPGLEAEMQLKPEFLAPDYCGSGKLAGMVAIVTGGDSGIGRAVAVLYAREGADVAIIYLNEHEDANDTKRYVEAEGQSCMLLPGDVRDAAFCRNAAEQVHERFGRLDILVNNAAFQEHAEKLTDLTEERFDLTMKTNVYGYFHMAKAVLPYLKRGAAIINTGSVTGLKGSKHLLDYSTTKGAIHAFTMSLASNLLEHGIRVNAIAPGPVWTPLNPADAPADQVAQFGADTDMQRPAQPQELSPAYVFLAAPCCSSYITGIVLPMTGSVGE
ncbi:SDR family oxidoreductase [Duganella violaceipulchra]|uniref:NAD(P)-dependent dehydrogenase (Short-subunit alcohol dehydrogenase family) n=1 Tax=Duganella violaceipulchra TaxID=2849652 RepID=A0AA41HDM3_9BURK|nr:SDR family oxidoreductase [Duganella violaceicalia]MBV6322609.1 SDR family oxidoreductase [Duganella violaceicalia]MCP2010822.1 NAD(P)-dependent dehydrogenase (short-subunit alcohol dehydrogenase family) [Duganella violaceicalia]